MSVLTKKALLNALGVMLIRKPLNKITIADLTEECGISRMTFYYHFKDIYDLLQWAVETQLEDALQGNVTYETWKQGFLNVFYFALKYKSYALRIIPDMDPKYLYKYLWDLGYRLSLRIVEDKAVGRNVEEQDRQFIARICSHALVGALMDWAEKGMKESPENVVQRFCTMFDGTIEVTLARMESM